MQGRMGKGYDPGPAEFWDCPSSEVREARQGAPPVTEMLKGFPQRHFPRRENKQAFSTKLAEARASP